MTSPEGAGPPPITINADKSPSPAKVDTTVGEQIISPSAGSHRKFTGAFDQTAVLAATTRLDDNTKSKLKDGSSDDTFIKVGKTSVR